LKGESETKSTQSVSAGKHPLRRTNAGRVLVVEDNVVNQRLAKLLVEKLGYDVDLAENGQQAVDKFASQSYDLALMDCQMPILDGFEATRQVRSRAPGTRTPIIAMTASAMDGDREQCLRAGMDDYLTKPLDLGKLQTAIERWTLASRLSSEPLC
jgi:CheY-like chemotaxis protein